MNHIDIEICMGSSCFSRGNRKNLEVLKSYLKDNGLESKVSLKGALCWGKCAEGPNIKINGELVDSMTPECLIDLVEYHLNS